MKLEELKVYNYSMEFAEELWTQVARWHYFEKDTIGKQLIRAADSVSANLSEGYGRYHYKESKHFAYYSRGSLFEVKTWLTKANNRSLIDDNKYEEFYSKINTIGKMLNAYINSIGT